MSINATVDGTTYNGIENITVGGKNIALTSDAGWTASGFADGSEPSGAIRIENISTIQTNKFVYCGGITSVTIIPSVNWGGVSHFQGCTNLAVVDMYNAPNGLTNFQNCSNLNTIIIRKTGSISTLSFDSLFNGTPLASGGTGGTAYVPSALISAYEADSKWSAFAITFTAIEGSQYEHTYADGTAVPS